MQEKQAIRHTEGQIMTKIQKEKKQEMMPLPLSLRAARGDTVAAQAEDSAPGAP